MEEKSKGVTKKIIAAGVAAATCAVFATACTAPWSREQDQKTDAMAKTKSAYLNPFKNGKYRMDCEWSQPRDDAMYGTENGIRYAEGCCLGAKKNTKLYAIADGKVNMVKKDYGGYGRYLEYYIGKRKAPNGRKAKTWVAYGHVNKTYVKKGQKIKKGQLIATVGSAPNSKYTHLQMEVWVTKPGPKNYGHCQYSVDPLYYIPNLYKIGKGGSFSKGLKSRAWGKKMYRPGAPWIAATKNANTLKVKGKSVSVSLKAKNRTISVKKAVSITKKGQGKISYSKASGNKKITIKSGKIMIRKGLKKGTYKVKIKVKAAGNGSHRAVTRTAASKIIVK